MIVKQIFTMTIYKYTKFFLGYLLLFIFIISCASTDRSRNSGSELNHKREYTENDDIEKHKSLGNMYYPEKSFKKTEKEFKAILKLKPYDADAHYKLGVIYGRKGMIKESRSKLLKTISIDPEYGKAYYNLGVIYSLQGECYDIDKSVFFFKKYLIIEPESTHKAEINEWLLKFEKKTNSVIPNIDDGVPSQRKATKNWLKNQSELIGIE